MQSVVPSPLRLLAAGMAASLLLGVAACSDDDKNPVEPPVATSIEASAGNNQTIAVSAISEPLVVTVMDQDDAGMQGVSVTWVVVTGEGTLSTATSTTNADGDASVVFTAPATAGTITITATVAGLDPVTFTITVQ